MTEIRGSSFTNRNWHGYALNWTQYLLLFFSNHMQPYYLFLTEVYFLCLKFTSKNKQRKKNFLIELITKNNSNTKFVLFHSNLAMDDIYNQFFFENEWTKKYRSNIWKNRWNVKPHCAWFPINWMMMHNRILFMVFKWRAKNEGFFLSHRSRPRWVVI